MKKEVTKILWGAALTMFCGTANAQLTCTQTPDCASLGYNKTAAQCTHGGVKCPFDSTKMFCLKNTSAYNFQLKVPATLYNIVYSDGSHAANYTASKTKWPIGVVGLLHDNMGRNRGLIVSKDQPITGTYAEAIEFCNNYSIIGTNPGDWRLPTAEELLLMAGDYRFDYTYGIKSTLHTQIDNKLMAMRRGERFLYSYSVNYPTSGLPDYMTGTANNYNRYIGYDYWTTDDCYANPTTSGVYVTLNVQNAIYLCVPKANKLHFRCVMDF